MTGTTVRARRKRWEPSPADLEKFAARKAEIQRLADATDRNGDRVQEFLARWGTRYSEHNLIRLWVQAPDATVLHKRSGWYSYGRKVRDDAEPILLMQPRVSRDEDKVTPDNPKGEQFKGAHWMSLFDFAQTVPVDGYDDTAKPTTASKKDLDKLKQLRKEALDVHPDLPDGTTALFQAAWAVYENFRTTIYPRRRNQGDVQDRG